MKELGGLPIITDERLWLEDLEPMVRLANRLPGREGGREGQSRR